MERRGKMETEMGVGKEIIECKDKGNRKNKESVEVMNGFEGLSKAIRYCWEGSKRAPSGFLSTLSTVCSIKSMYKEDINV